MKTKLAILKILGMVALGVAIFACGGPKAKEQKERKLTSQGTPDGFLLSDSALQLSDGSFQKLFTGSLIIWQPEVEPEGIASVAKVSGDMIDNGVKQLKYIKKEIAPLAADFDQKLATITEKGTALAQKSYGMSMMAAATYLPGSEGNPGVIAQTAFQLATQFPGETLSEQEIGQAKKNFLLYCEAKIWERAVNHTLVKESYKMKRPTPSALCEGVYRDFGLMVDSTPECAGSGEYKNYFGCLWRQGVMKTTLWRTRYPAGSDVNEKIGGLSDASLIAFFAQGRQQGAQLLQQRLPPVSITSVETGAAVEVDLTYQSTGVGPEAAAVQDIINNIERRAVNDDAFRFLPLAGHSEGAQAFLAGENLKVFDSLKFFNQLAPRAYVNENLFNLVFQKDSLAKSDITWTPEKAAEAAQRFPSIVSISSPELDQLRAEIAALKPKLIEIGTEAQGKFVEIDPTLCEADPDADTLQCEGNRLTEKAKKTIAPKDVAKAAWQSEVVLVKEPSGKELVAQVRLNKTLADYREVSVPMPQAGKGGKGCEKSTGVAVDGTKMEIDEGCFLTITVPVEDPLKWGLGAADRSNLQDNFSFNEIPEAHLENVDFVFHAGLNYIDDVLITFVGDVKIKKNKKILYDGSVKFKDDTAEMRVLAKDFMKKLKELQ